MNGHDFTLEQNTEARMMLAVARRGLAAAINDAENGIGHLSCDDPKIMEQVRAHWRRLYDTYMNADALLSDLESCARHLTDGDKWEPNPIADGMSLGSLNPDLFPLYDTMDDRIGVRALFEQDGRFHLIDSLLERTGEGRTPLRFIRETLSIHHGKLSKKMLASAMNGTLDPERWTVLSSRNVGRPGVRGELSADAKRYLPPDRSICGAFVKDTDIATELLPVSPTLTVSPARPVVTLFDASIERLDYDKDGIHLKFRNEGKEREVTPNSLVNMVSSGTLRGGALVGRALETLRAGGYLIVDELENSINKQLVFAIMDLFASPVTNPHGATLLFSTHYPELLDHFTRKDSIWFAVRDGKGFALRNLGAYLGRTDLKKSVSFFANRVPGTAPSYAAVRALQDYAERYVHA